jgi:hypothetical protein
MALRAREERATAAPEGWRGNLRRATTFGRVRLALQPGPGYRGAVMTKPAASRLARHLRRLGHRVRVRRHRAPGRGLLFYTVERLGR